MHPHTQLTIDRALASGVKITDDHVRSSNTLQEVALDYVKEYKGFNSFVQSLAVQLADRGTLSIAQMRGALNCMVAEARTTQANAKNDAWAAETIAKHANKPVFQVPDVPMVKLSIDQHLLNATQPVDLSDGPVYQEPIKPFIPCGKFTVPLNDDATEYRTLRVQDASWSDKPSGTVSIGFLSGPDNNRNYTHFAFVLPNGKPIVSRKFHNSTEINRALTLLLVEGAAPGYGHLWAMASSRCFICGRMLTTPESKAAGIGPICAEATGIDSVALALMGSKDAAIEENNQRDRWVKAQTDIDELFDY